MAKTTIQRGGVDWRQVRVGLVTLVALVVLAYAVIRIGSLFNLFTDRYPLYTRVESVAGLTEGSLVTVAGQRVGQVAAIEFLPVGEAAPANLLVRLEVEEAVREQIREDSRASIRAQGLLGDKYVNIEPGTAGTRVLQPGDTLPTATTVDVDALLATAEETLDATAAILDNLRPLTDALAQGEGTLGRLIYDDRLYAQLVDVTAETDALLARMQAPDGTFGRLLRDPELYERLTSAAGAVEALGDTLLAGSGSLPLLLRDDAFYRSLLATTARADTAIGGIATLTEGFGGDDGTLQRLMADPELYDQLLKAVVDLQTLIRDIRENPDRYKPEVMVDVF